MHDAWLVLAGITYAAAACDCCESPPRFPQAVVYGMVTDAQARVTPWRRAHSSSAARSPQSSTVCAWTW